MITRFPRAWLWLVDETIPLRVKKEYSPRDSWRDKPFSKEDAQFFFKGIDELSSLFTEERPKGMPAYFSHPKYRSAYLLYFLPLQAAKFLTLFQSHSQAIDAALKSARKSGTLHIADLGVGPGTASLSFLLLLLDQSAGSSEEIPNIEFYWFDTQDSIMKDGIAFVEALSSQFPKLRGRVKVHTKNVPWWKAGPYLPERLSLVFMGHVLNESSHTFQTNVPFWQNLFKRTDGGGVLIVEPAARKTSQQLSKLRNFLIESELIAAEPEQFWGPCLHAGGCPLADGRDWCHFSAPLQIPGRWFRDFSIGLGSERQWVKYSYLWIASPTSLAPKKDPSLRRVVSDPLHSKEYTRSPNSRDAPSSVLICEPDTAGRWTVPPQEDVGRGDLIKIE